MTDLKALATQALALRKALGDCFTDEETQRLPSVEIVRGLGNIYTALNQQAFMLTRLERDGK